METYPVNLRIQSEYEHFLHSVSNSVVPFPKLENDNK